MVWKMPKCISKRNIFGYIPFSWFTATSILFLLHCSCIWITFVITDSLLEQINSIFILSKKKKSTVNYGKIIIFLHLIRNNSSFICMSPFDCKKHMKEVILMLTFDHTIFTGPCDSVDKNRSSQSIAEENVIIAIVNLYIFLFSCDAVIQWTIIRMFWLPWISLIIATILIVRDFIGIIEHLPVRGHIQEQRIHNFLSKGYWTEFSHNF